MKIRHSFMGGRFHKKGFFLIVNIQSMQVGYDNDLQHVGILMTLSKSKLLSRFLKIGFSVDKLKLPNKRKFSCEELKKFKGTLMQIRKFHYMFEFI